MTQARYYGQDRDASGRTAPHPDAPKARGRSRIHLDRHRCHALHEGLLTHVAIPVRTSDVPHKHVAGDRLAVMRGTGRGTTLSAWVDVVSVRVVPARALDFRQLGYVQRWLWRLEWLQRWEPTWRKAVDDFEADGDELDDDLVELIWQQRWYQRDVWLMKVAIDRLESPIYAAAGAGTRTTSPEGSLTARGYTTDPAQALDTDTVTVNVTNEHGTYEKVTETPLPAVDLVALEGMVLANRDRFLQLHDAETREQLEADHRATVAREVETLRKLAAGVTVARAAGIDITRELRLVGKASDAIERLIADRRQAARLAS